MGNQVDLEEAIRRIRAKDNRYDGNLYGFVLLALEYTCLSLGEYRHVSAKEMVQGMCDYAKEVYGLMAYTFLNRWGIHSTRDIGTAVFYLIDEGVLFKRDGESIEDFDDVLDLQKTLEDNYFN